MYRDYIATAIYYDWWATIDTSSGLGVRGTSFRAIPQSTKIINQINNMRPLTVSIASRHASLVYPYCSGYS